MSFIPAGFRNSFALPVVALAALGLSACQPVLQAQTGHTVPVVFPSQQPATPATETETSEATASATVLNADEAVAEPSDEAATLLGQADPDENTQTSGQNQAEEEAAVIVVRRAAEPAEPAPLPQFNPAKLVGRPQSFVNAQFGKADFSRTEGVIHVLQYRQPDCVIDLFISIGNSQQTTPPAHAKIIDWAMRERTVNQPLDLTLCQQQFFERKL